MKVITRFAPSPTGTLSSGNARSCLFAYATARNSNGICNIRYEDSDPTRSNDESLRDIASGLHWLGFKFDNGPTFRDILEGKKDERYFQSKRKDIYDQEIAKLLKQDKAYELNGAIFFRMPKDTVTFTDQILGEITVSNEDALKDFPIRRKDGSIIFHMAMAVDDFHAGTNFIVRGADHVSNVPKHIRLFEALGAEVPKFAHCPLVCDSHGAKLSKRRSDQHANIIDFRQDGLYPQTVINYLALLGWSMPNGKEEFDLEEMISCFDITRVGKSSARFDHKKLISFNTTRLRRISTNELETDLLDYVDYMDNHHKTEYRTSINYENNFENMLELCKTRSTSLKDILSMLKMLSPIALSYDPKIWVEKFGNGKVSFDLSSVRDRLSIIDNWTKEEIMEVLRISCQELDIKLGDIAQVLRFATTGSLITPPIDTTLEVIGQFTTIKRIDRFLEKIVTKALDDATIAA